jgi:sulfur carrier protein
MKIVVNGENLEFDNGSSLQAIIDSLKIEDKVMAAAVNMDIVKKDNWSNFIINENDKIELLQFVGGG